MTTETKLTSVYEVSKSQNVRLIDVFFIGPVLIYAGMQNKLSPELNALLILFGGATIFYNGKNYLANK